MSNRVQVKFTGEKSQLDSTIHGIGHSLKELKSMALAAFTFEAAKEMAVHIFEVADSIVETAEKLGITIEQVQILKKVAKDSGVEFETLAAAIGKVAVARGKALEGDKESIAKLKAAGVDVSTLKDNNSADILFKQMGEKVKHGNLDSVAAGLSGVLGKGFASLIPALKTDIDEVGSHMKEFGMLMDTKTAVSLKVLGESFKEIGLILLVQLAPAILAASQAIFDATAAVAGNTAGLAAELGDFSVQLQTLIRDGAQANGQAFDWAQNDSYGSNARKPWEGMSESLKDEIKKITEELLHPSGNKSGDSIPVKAGKAGGKIYSDSLTGVGNMLGASFAKLGEATQIDLMKQHNELIKQTNSKLDKLYEKIAHPEKSSVDGGFNYSNYA